MKRRSADKRRADIRAYKKTVLSRVRARVCACVRARAGAGVSEGAQSAHTGE